MTKQKNTKRALLASVLSMMLCMAMLVGSTFAWFTDSVTSGKNKIVAGNLDVELEYSTNGSDWATVAADTNLFKPTDGEDATLWEPGHTEYVYLRVRNAGSLALKYRFAVNVFGDEAGGAEKEYTNVEGKKFKLSEHLVFTKAEGTAAVTDRESLWIKDAAQEKAAMGDLSGLGMEGTLLFDENKAITLAVYMPTQVGNEANQKTELRDTEGAPTIYLGLTLNATQTPFESDSFDNQYDASAAYPITDSTELNDKVQNAQPGDTVLVAAGNFDLPQTIGDGVFLKGDGAGTVMTVDKDRITAKGVTLSDMTINGKGASGNDGSLNISGVNTTLSNINFKGQSGQIGIAVSTSDPANETVFDTLTINDTFRGIQFWNLSGDTYIKNSFLNGPVYTFNIDAVTPGARLFVTDTVLKGWTSYTKGVQLVSFENCEFASSGSYNYCRPYSETVFKNCDFTEDFRFNAGGNAEYTITFENCRINGAPVTVENIDSFKDANNFNPNADVVVR